MSDHSPVIWNMPIKGNVNSQELWGYYVYSAGNGLGYYDAFAATQLTLIQEGTQASKASASPVNKRDLTISELHTL